MHANKKLKCGKTQGQHSLVTRADNVHNTGEHDEHDLSEFGFQTGRRVLLDLADSAMSRPGQMLVSV